LRTRNLGEVCAEYPEENRESKIIEVDLDEWIVGLLVAICKQWGINDREEENIP